MDSKTQEGGLCAVYPGSALSPLGKLEPILAGVWNQRGERRNRIDSVTVIRRGAERTGLLIRD